MKEKSKYQRTLNKKTQEYRSVADEVWSLLTYFACVCLSVGLFGLVVLTVGTQGFISIPLYIYLSVCLLVVQWTTVSYSHGRNTGLYFHPSVLVCLMLTIKSVA